MERTVRLTIPDIIIVVGYFVFVIGIGLYASCRSYRGTVSGYFLAGRNMNWFMVGASIFVSNIGAEHFMGLAGSGAAGGIGVGAWEVLAVCTLQILGYLFFPVYLAAQVRTTPEYLGKRFGGQRLRLYYSILSLLFSILTKCSVGLFSGAVFLQQALGWDLYLSVGILILIVAILTVTGGLTAVIYTDSFQCLLMLAGAIAVTILGFREVGGFEGLWRKYPLAVVNVSETNLSCGGGIHPQWDTMLRDLSDPDYPWLGFIVGAVPTITWYLCADQVMAQRTLAARSLSHGQIGTQFTAVLKVLPFYLLVFPGMISRVLFTDEVACADPVECDRICQNPFGCTNIAFPKLVLEVLPTGLRGLMMSVLMAALMSGLDSMFNSTSAIFVVDIWTRVRKDASVREQMIIGRVFMVVVAGLAMLWIPVLKGMNSGQIFLYMAELMNYLAPGITALYVVAMLWPRCTEKGAFYALMSAQLFGFVRLILVWVFAPPYPCSGTPDTRPAFIKDVPYLYVAGGIFIYTTVACVVFSLLTTPLPYKYLYRTTYWTRRDKYDKNDIKEGKVLVTWSRFGFIRTELSTQDEQELLKKDKETTFIHDSLLTKCDVSEESNSLLAYQDKRENTSAESKEGESKENTGTCRSCQELVISWLCGVKALSGKSDDQEISAQRAQDARALSLEQKTSHRILIFLLGVITFISGVGQLVFWSVWKYTPDASIGVTKNP